MQAGLTFLCRNTTGPDSRWGYRVQAGVNTKSHDSKRMETCLWFSPIVVPICGSVQTLCYHYCAPLWPHPRSGKAWEKTRTIIVADHPPDTVQCWDCANWGPCWASTCTVKWLDAEEGQGGGFFVFERAPWNFSLLLQITHKPIQRAPQIKQ